MGSVGSDTSRSAELPVSGLATASRLHFPLIRWDDSLLDTLTGKALEVIQGQGLSSLI